MKNQNIEGDGFMVEKGSTEIHFHPEDMLLSSGSNVIAQVGFSNNHITIGLASVDDNGNHPVIKTVELGIAQVDTLIEYLNKYRAVAMEWVQWESNIGRREDVIPTVNNLIGEESMKKNEVKTGYYNSNNRPKVGDLVCLADDFFTRRSIAEGEDVWLGPMRVTYDNTLCVQCEHPTRGEVTFYFHSVVPYHGK